MTCSGPIDDTLREAMKQIAAAKGWNCFVVDNKNNTVYFKSLPDAEQFEKVDGGHWDSYVEYPVPWTYLPGVGVARGQGDVFNIACSGPLDDTLVEAMKQMAAAKGWNCLLVELY